MVSGAIIIIIIIELTCASFRLSTRNFQSVMTSSSRSVVRDLGVYLDNELTMNQHISRVVSSRFFQLRRLRQICRSVGEEVTKRLVTALVLSRLDYCNAVLALSLTGLPESTIRMLERVQNAAVRLITDTKPMATSLQYSDALTLAANKITNYLHTNCAS